MNIKQSLYISGIFCSAFAVAACGDDTSGTGGGGGGTGTDATTSTTSTTSTTATTTTTSTTSSTGTGGSAAMAMVRVAHLSPDAPAIDFCVKGSSAATFTGPVMNSLLKVTAGLAYPNLTAYLPLPADKYTVRIVAPGQSSCETALAKLPDVKDLAVEADKSYTVAAIGQLMAAAPTKPFEIKAFADDDTVDAQKAKVRFIHASANTPNVDVGTGAADKFMAIFSNVKFGDEGVVGGKKYLETPALSKVTLSARATGTVADALVLNNVDVPAGAIVTAFAIGNLGDKPQPLKVLVCVDNAPAANNLTPCTALP
ncbi:MAG: DUF4397 domain-containing protein [Byssovorax sp.]